MSYPAQLSPEEQERRRALRPSPRGEREIRVLVDHQVREVARLERSAAEAMAPVLAQAERELREQLAHWIETRPDGELRWTAQHYREALAQITRMREELERGMGAALGTSTDAAQHLALHHLEQEIGKYSRLFGAPRAVSLDVTRQIATGRSYIIPRIHSSSKRYAEQVGRDIQQRLAVDMLKGAPLSETIDRLVRDGGPRGLVALRGVVGEEGAITELIPEGLFQRYRWWAERVVRTETQSAYNAQTLDGLHEARNEIPGLQKRWYADAAACKEICGPIDGQVRNLETPFDTPRGPVEHAPAHPNCGCRSGAWHPEWSGVLRKAGIEDLAGQAPEAAEPASATATGNESESRPKANGTRTVETGGRRLIERNFNRPDLFTEERLEEYPRQAYEVIRASTEDVAAIAGNTGWDELRIQEIKQHLFVRKHQLDDRVDRFDPDPDIADAWERMRRGTHRANDLRLLEHEYFEARFERLFQADYRTAHNAALRAGKDWKG